MASKLIFRSPATQLLLAIGFIVGFLAVTTDLAQAQEHRAIVAYEEFPPYSFTNAEGRAEGYSIDLLRHLTDAAGIDLSFVPANNPAEIFEMMDAGDADISSLLALTPARLARAKATLEVGAFHSTAFSLKKRGFSSPDDLTGLRIGAVRGSFGVVGARKVPFAEIVEFENNDALVIPLLTGEIDAVASEQKVFLRRLRDAGVDQQVQLFSQSLVSAPFGFLVSSAKPRLHEALNAAIRDNLTAAQLRLLQERWFGHPTRLTEKPTFWVICGIIAGCALIVLVMVQRLLKHERKAERLLKSNTANNLLIKALDEINAAIVIYDNKMRAMHRNSGFSKCFPSVTAEVDKGLDMASLIEMSYINRSVMTKLEDAELRGFVDDIVSKAINGEDNTRIVRASNGTVFEARDFPLGDSHYASIRVNITAQHAQQALIRQQADELQKSNEQLHTFASMAAHDLRAPLRHLSTLAYFAEADLVDEGIEVPEGVQQRLNDIQGKASRMSRLVEDLLRYARAGTALGEEQWIDPAPIVREAVGLIDNREHITISIPDDMPKLFADPTAFQAIMRNLIGNAVKYHDRDHGIVRVEACVRTGFVDIIVSDDGAGIPEQFLETIFEPFKRLSSDNAGSGLGLAFVKRTVEEWGGSITVSSAEQRGSTFTLSIPTPEQGRPHGGSIH